MIVCLNTWRPGMNINPYQSPELIEQPKWWQYFTPQRQRWITLLVLVVLSLLHQTAGVIWGMFFMHLPISDAPNFFLLSCVHVICGLCIGCMATLCYAEIKGNNR